MTDVVNARFHAATLVNFEVEAGGVWGEDNSRFHQTFSCLQGGNGNVVVLAVVPEEEAVISEDAMVASDGFAARTGLEPRLVFVCSGNGFLNEVAVLQAAAHDPGASNAVEVMRCSGENGNFSELCGLKHVEFARLFATDVQQQNLFAIRWVYSQNVLASGKLVTRVPGKQDHLIQHTSQSKPHQFVLVLPKNDGEKTAVGQGMNGVDETVASGEEVGGFVG